MGADWVKFRIRPTADAGSVRRIADFVSRWYPHGHGVLCPRDVPEFLASADKAQRARKELEAMLLLPRGGLENADYFDLRSLTDPPGNNLRTLFGTAESAVPPLSEIEVCRVYVISHNPVFPIEWRDEAYRIILPDELPTYFERWHGYIEQVTAGRWQQYLHELYLIDRLRDEHQYQEFDRLLGNAQESRARANAWCRREGLGPVRDRILAFNALQRLKAMHESIPCPVFARADFDALTSAEQFEQERCYWALRQEAAAQIKAWNRFAPKNRKVQYPCKMEFATFIACARSAWLHYFFEWCAVLIREGYGLFLWA
jgi:hypothetical protein